MNNILIMLVIFITPFFFTITTLLLIDFINKKLEIYKKKQIIKEIISIPSGEIIKIDLYNFDLLSGNQIHYDNEIRDWVIGDYCWITKNLKKNKLNCQEETK